MIPRTLPAWQGSSWQEELSACVRDPDELIRLLHLEGSPLALAEAAWRQFPLRVPRPYLNRMRPGDPEDPLLLQVLPLAAETEPTPGFIPDPLGEQQSNPVRGLIHKYHGRVLLVVSPACAIHCRYCFRRHFPYDENTPSRRQWQAALDYLQADASISEVILSGGDPLAANDRQLAWLCDQLAAIPHLRRLRVHTRFPIVIPSRITDECLAWLTGTRLLTSMVVHVNHANELDGEVAAALAALRRHGVTLLNQTVLLKGINDRPEVLGALSERLYECGVLPYYLHVLDRVDGAAHFDVDEQRAVALTRDLLARLPGYLVPKLVREVAGETSKSPVPLGEAIHPAQFHADKPREEPECPQEKPCPWKT